jgi:hypothetical protein
VWPCLSSGSLVSEVCAQHREFRISGTNASNVTNVTPRHHSSRSCRHFLGSWHKLILLELVPALVSLSGSGVVMLSWDFSGRPTRPPLVPCLRDIARNNDRQWVDEAEHGKLLPLIETRVTAVKAAQDSPRCQVQSVN